MTKEGKKRFFNKKNIIFAIAIVLIASIAATFFVSCNNGGDKPPEGPLYSQDSTMLKTPTDGSTPTDYDAKTNAYYAVYAMSQLQSFTTQSQGETVTKVAFASVSQKIKGSRVINGTEVYKENVSHSSFRSVGTRLFIKGDNYVVHNADKVSSVNEVTWEKAAGRISKDSFLEKFGYVPNSVTSYILTDETILSAKFLGEQNGIYSFRYELDPIKSTANLRLEMRTMAGNDSLPVFEKASITVRMDKTWQVTEVVTDSVYEVDMLGGVTCTESVVETFSNFNKGVAVPNASFYNSYVDAEITEPKPVTLTATDYLMEGFSDYITGTKPLKLTANVTADSLSANVEATVTLNMDDLSSTSLSVALKDFTYKNINLNDISLFYENSNIYLNAGKFKAVTDIDELSGFAGKISSLFGLDMLSMFEGVDIDSLDFNSLISGATLTETDTLATVSIPLSLGDTTINAQVVFAKGEKIEVKEITATVGKVEIALAVKDDIVAPQKGEGYNAITPLLQVIGENVAIKAEVAEITALVNINLKTFDVDAYIENLEISDCELGEVKAKLVKDTLYANILGLKAKLNVNEIENVLDKLAFLPMDETSLPDFSAFESIDVVALVADAINSLSTQETQDGLSVGLNVLGFDFNLLLAVTEQGYSLGQLTIDFEGTNVKAELFDGEVVAIDNDDLVNYNDVATLLDVIEDNQINLKVNALGLDVDLNVDLTNFTIVAKTTLYGETLYAKIAEEKVYVSYKGLNGYVAFNDLEKVLANLGVFIGEVTLPDFSEITVEEVIKSLTVTDSKVITIGLSIAGINANVVLDKSNGLTLSNVTATVGETVVSAAPSTKADYSGMTATEYCNLVSLLDVIVDNEVNLKLNALGLDVDVSINLTDFTIFAKTSLFGETLYAKIADDKVYVSYKGLNGYIQLSDVEKVLAKLGVFIGEVTLPDFSEITVEEVIKSLTVTDTDVVAISLNISGIDASIVLDKTNGLTLSSVTATMGETVVSATPSTKADYTGMTATEYYNLVTLPDVIEDNQIDLKVNALGLDIDLNVDLTNFTIVAKTTLYGETLYAKIAEEKVYVSYKGLNGYIQLSDVEKVLAKLGVFIGEVTLPDFSEITVEEVIKSLTVTDSEVITIGLSIAGINANVVLDKSNGLTLSSVTATMGETVVSATPSTKADYSGMTATEYYNLVSLLDVIDANGKISLTAQAFGATIYLTVDLPNNQILASLDDFEILVDLTESVAYARYPGASLKLNLDEIDVMLKELKPIITKFISQEEYDSINLDAFKTIKIEDVISSVVVTESQDYLTISLSIASVNAVVVADKTSNGLSISCGSVKMGEIDVTFTTGATPLDFTFDKTANYIGVTELVQTLAPALGNILNLDNLYASMTATIVSGNTTIEIKDCEVLITNIYSAPKARATVTVKITTNNADGSISVSEHKITLFYLDPSLVGEGQVNTYFTYDNTADADVFAGTFTTVNFNQTLDIVKQIYANMPELQAELAPFIVADSNGMPKFMDIDVDFSKLINSAFFENGVLSVDANGKAILSQLPSSVLLNLFSKDGLLCLGAKDLSFDDIIITLDARVGEAPSGVITEDKFEFTPLSTASDFSSINELLLALKNTSAKRHFYIDANIDLAGTGLLSWLKLNDKISADLYLDVIDEKAYFKAIIVRQPVSLIVMDVWKDYGGTGTIYFDPDTQMIYVHNRYTVKGGSLWRPTYTEHDEYLKYTVDEFMADPLTAVFDVLRVSDSLNNLINGETSDDSTTQNVATIENTFKSYSYNGTDTFNITLDLAPLTTDIKKATVAIKHDAEYNLTALNAAVNMIGILDLKLSATLQTSDVSYGTDVEAKAIALDPNFN